MAINPLYKLYPSTVVKQGFIYYECLYIVEGGGKSKRGIIKGVLVPLYRQGTSGNDNHCNRNVLPNTCDIEIKNFVDAKRIR